MPKWEVELIGDKDDLQAIFEDLRERETRPYAVTNDGQTYRLVSTKFDTLTDIADVQRIASEQIRIIDGAARFCLNRVQPLTTGLVSVVHDSGDRENYGAISLAINYRVAASDNGGGLTDVQFRRALAMAERDESSKRILQLFAGNPSLADLYSVYEIIREQVGGANQIVDKHWAKKGDLNRFTMTANNPDAGGDGARHAIKGKRPIKITPVSVEEADQLVRTLAMHLFQSMDATAIDRK